MLLSFYFCFSIGIYSFLDRICIVKYKRIQKKKCSILSIF